MKKLFPAMVIILFLARPLSGMIPEDLKNGPVLLVTSEYTPYSRMMEPSLVNLLKKYKIAVCLCVRENQLTDELDRLYQTYDSAGVPILMWPLLPMKDGLYLNKRSTGVYLDYLDVLFDWAEKRGHKIQALVIDVEPSYVAPKPGEKPPTLIQNIKRIRKELGRKSFDDSIPEFAKINDKIHAHGALSVAAAFPFTIDDRIRGTHGWEDFTGGPVATIDWDYFCVMMYSSWFVEQGKVLGMDWDAAHWVAYDYSLDLKKIWGDKAAVAVGVTNAGQGDEKVIYASAAEIAPAIAAVRQAGVNNIGIYDMKGILESGDPESWLKTLQDTRPGLPEKGKASAKRFRSVLKFAGSLIEGMRK